MGIHLNLAVLLREIVGRHGIAGRVATLGEQSLSFDPDRGVAAASWPDAAEVAAEVASGQPGAGQKSLAKSLAKSPAARLFARFGFAATESIDIIGCKGVTHLFDLNLPDTPAGLVGKFDLVFNGGTLEHVFHLPNALANVSRMLGAGGVALHVLPCNNWVDHGFYQFSPCLMFDYYRAAGFECLESMLLGFTPEQPDRWLVRCAMPGLFGAGFAGALDDGIYLHLFAARRSRSIILHPMPIQAPYADADDEAAAAAVDPRRDRLRPRWFLPFVLSEGRRQEMPSRAESPLMPASFAAEIGHAWAAPMAEFAALADSVERPARSPLILLEDGLPLGPAHATHADIRERGRGRYSHWGETLYFASSDNSPPNANGRRYVAVIPGSAQLTVARGGGGGGRSS